MDDLAMWREYAAVRPLPAHQGHHLLQLTSFYAAGHTPQHRKPPLPDDLLVWRKPKRVEGDSRARGVEMSRSLRRIKAAVDGSRKGKHRPRGKSIKP